MSMEYFMMPENEKMFKKGWGQFQSAIASLKGLPTAQARTFMRQSK